MFISDVVGREDEVVGREADCFFRGILPDLLMFGCPWGRVQSSRRLVSGGWCGGSRKREEKRQGIDRVISHKKLTPEKAHSNKHLYSQ
jgi:hypothetical protein